VHRSEFLSFIWLIPPFVCLVGLALPLHQNDLNKKISLNIRSADKKQFGKGLNGNGANQEWKKLSEFPYYLKEIIILAEDKRFIYHNGIDPIAIGHSIYTGIFTKQKFRGASTITQQLVRSINPDILSLPFPIRKIIEIALALKYSMWINKDQILESYLNTISIHSNYDGFPAAAKRYFKKDIRFLSIQESIALIVLIRSNSPPISKFKERCISLRDKFDKSIVMDLDYLTNSLELNGNTETIENSVSSENLHFERWIRTLYPDQKGILNTHLSSNTNHHIHKIVLSELESLKKYNATNAAVIVLKLSKGNEPLKLISMIGSKNFFEENSGQVNGTLAYRDAGSTLKPLLYGLGLEKKIFTPNSIFHDEEKSFQINQSGEIYSPRNADLQFWGDMTLAEALSNSRNIPAVDALQKISITDFHKFLRIIGWNHLNQNPDKFGLGLALGTGGTTLLQLTYAYSSYAMKGKLIPLEIGTIEGMPIAIGKEIKIFSDETAEEISSILMNNELRKRAFGNRNFLDFPYPVAVKTGTSKDYRNSWTIGYTSGYVVGVWVGNFSGERSNEVSGTFGAGRIFHSVMRYLMEDNSDRTFSFSKLREYKICRKTGKLASENCNHLTIHMRNNNKSLPICKDHLDSIESAEFISPIDGQIFIYHPFLRKDTQSIPIRVRIAKNKNVIILWNEKETLKLNSDGQTKLPLIQGIHNLTLIADNQILQNIQIIVK